MKTHRDELGFRIVGYLRNGDSSVLEGYECLGSIDDAEECPRARHRSRIRRAAARVITAMMQLLDRLVRSLVSIHVVPDLLQFMVLRSRVEDIDGLPTINLSETPLEGWSAS